MVDDRNWQLRLIWKVKTLLYKELLHMLYKQQQEKAMDNILKGGDHREEQRSWMQIIR